MAQQSPDLTGRRAGVWDFEEWLRGQGCAVGQASLTPTALLAAAWQVGALGSNPSYIDDILFATDTAIGWTLWRANAAVATPQVALQNLYTGGSVISFPNFGAGLIAAPAIINPIVAGFAPAGFFGSIMGRMKIYFTGSSYYVLSTAAVAANCAATIVFIDATA